MNCCLFSFTCNRDSTVTKVLTCSTTHVGMMVVVELAVAVVVIVRAGYVVVLHLY
jgi:hypothetical protein